MRRSWHRFVASSALARALLIVGGLTQIPAGCGSDSDSNRRSPRGGSAGDGAGEAGTAGTSDGGGTGAKAGSGAVSGLGGTNGKGGSATGGRATGGSAGAIGGDAGMAGDGAGGDAGAGGNAGNGGGGLGGCPGSPPTHGSTCSGSGTCHYQNCATFGRTAATCAGGNWDVETDDCAPFQCSTGAPCQGAQVCWQHGNPVSMGECIANPCGTGPVTCDCAPACTAVCTVDGGPQEGIRIYCTN